MRVVLHCIRMRSASRIHPSTRLCHWSSPSRTRAAPGCGIESVGDSIAMNGLEAMKVVGEPRLQSCVSTSEVERRPAEDEREHGDERR